MRSWLRSRFSPCSPSRSRFGQPVRGTHQLIALIALWQTACAPQQRPASSSVVVTRPRSERAVLPSAPPAPTPPPTPPADEEGLASALAPRSGTLPPVPPPPEDGAARAQWLTAQLDVLFGGPGLSPRPLGAGKISVAVLDHDSGRAIYSREARAQLNVASNVKLVTSSAALAALGPEYRFRTLVYGPQRTSGRYLEAGGELAGNVHLRGTGDPTLVTADLTDLANQLWALGIRRIKGDLVVDATFFDQRVVPPAYEQKEESAAFRAPSSATSLNGNAVAVTVVPAAQAGQPARVIVEPESAHLDVAGRVVTASKGPAWPTVETSAGPDGKTRVTLGGRVGLEQAPRTFYRRVVDPALYLGHTAVMMFARRGITITGQVKAAATPEGQRLLATHVSEPLGVVVFELNKRSNNFTAEQLVRTLGAEVVGIPGSWDKGLEAVARHLDAIGVKRGTYRMENAAGLYDSNRFSAEQMTQVIRAALRDFRIAGEFAASLSLAGIDGTLTSRMAGTPAERYVRAKSGTLLGTSALSGLAGSPGRGPLVFSILMNEVNDVALARAVQDRAAAVLAWYLNPGLQSTTLGGATAAAPSTTP